MGILPWIAAVVNRSLFSSVHRHSDDEGGSFGVIEVRMVIWKANDVCRKTTRLDDSLVARKNDVITLKEMNRLTSNCSANSSIYTLFLGHCFLPYGHVASWPCDYAIYEITNPQSYCGEDGGW